MSNKVHPAILSNRLNINSKQQQSCISQSIDQLEQDDKVSSLANINQDLQNQNKQKQTPIWQTSIQYKFIQYWQSLFNRRIISFSLFTVQVGDIIISSLLIAFLAYCCNMEHDVFNSGFVTDFAIALCIIFGCRNGLLSYIFGLSLERAVLWHQAMAWVSFGLSINHWLRSYQVAMYSGYFIQADFMLIILFSLKPIRRYMWELFMKMHWILIIGFFIGCILHPITYSVIAIGYFLLDILYRLYTVYKHRNISKEMKLERIGQNIVKLSMKKGTAKYKGGQYFFVMIPKLSYFQWHPFSVFSASYEEEIVIYVKVLGDWTSLLYTNAGEQGKPVILKGYLDGPYGSHSISIEGDKYKSFLCISGGIGVTPIISTAKEILHQIDFGRPVNNLHFVWTGRDSAIIQCVLKPDDLRSLLGQTDSQILKKFYHYSDKGDKKLEDLEKEKIDDSKEIVKIEKEHLDLPKYFETAYYAAQQSKDNLVGVLTCGPQQLIDSIEISSQKWSKGGIRFDVHQEVFNF